MDTYSKYPRGSEWRKWDLHIHSNASDGEMSCEEIIDKAIEKEISVIALTDHHTAKNIDKILKLGDQKGISVIPGIEFRTDKGKRSVHIIGLFPRSFNGIEITYKVLHDLILSPLGLSETEIIQKGKQKLKQSGTAQFNDAEAFREGIFECQVNFEEAADLIHDKLGGIVIVHAGSKSNSLEEEIYHEGKPDTNQHNSLGPLKVELFEKGFIDVCEISSEKDNAEFYLKTFYKPSITGSDAHKKDEIGTKAFWIKADPTFEGLKQIIYEPDRVWLQPSIPPKLEIVKNSPELFIDSIKIKSSLDNNEWFDKCEEIKLNNGLISVIGNKGSGKSALADIIGSSGNANTEYYSFLNPTKFLKWKNANKYKSIITLKDNYTYEKELLNPSHVVTEPSKVIYFSQSFVNNLCEDEDISRLREEIERVIFSHIPIEDRLGVNSLSDLINKRTGTIEKRIISERQKLSELNKEIVKLEDRLKPEVLIKLKNSLAEKQRIYKEIEKQKPKKVESPSEKDNAQILKDISEFGEKIKTLVNDIEIKQNAITKKNNDIFEFRKIEEMILDFERNYIELSDEIKQNDVFKETGIPIESIIKFTVNTIPIKTIYQQIEKEVTAFKNDINKLESQKTDIKIKSETLEKSLSEKQREFTSYKKELVKWEQKLKEIKGAADVKDSIEFFNKWINYIERDLKKEYEQRIEEREKVASAIVYFINQNLKFYPELYSHAKYYSDSRAQEFDIDIQDFLQFNSKVSIIRLFEKEFFDFINHRYAGTFHTIEKGRDQLHKIINQIDFNSEDSIASIPDRLINALHNDVSRDVPAQNDDFESQILEGKKTDLYNYIYGFSYLDPQFSITFGGKTIDYLSPGEKGTLLLIFYLLIDKDRRPIIIDQPEENLDNQTVYQKLVKFIKKVKEERQIIIVTHNPNLAIVCDSEQIIHANINKDANNLVRYTCGSIENFGMREYAINILEGTKPAFETRKNKYEIK